MYLYSHTYNCYKHCWCQRSFMCVLKKMCKTLGYIPKFRYAENAQLFERIWNCFQCYQTSLHFISNMSGASVELHHCQVQELSDFLTFSKLVDTKWHHIMILIYFSVIANEAEHLFMCFSHHWYIILWNSYVLCPLCTHNCYFIHLYFTYF